MPYYFTLIILSKLKCEASSMFVLHVDKCVDFSIIYLCTSQDALQLQLRRDWIFILRSIELAPFVASCGKPMNLWFSSTFFDCAFFDSIPASVLSADVSHGTILWHYKTNETHSRSLLTSFDMVVRENSDSLLSSNAYCGDADQTLPIYNLPFCFSKFNFPTLRNTSKVPLLSMTVLKTVAVPGECYSTITTRVCDKRSYNPGRCAAIY